MMRRHPACPAAGHTAGEQLLRADRLSRRYRGGRTALRGVSVSLGPGVTVLVGPNGAGKTTLLRVLAAILRPSQGCLYWCGTPVALNPVAYRDVIGYLSQDFAPYDDMSPRRFLAYMATLKGIPHRLRWSRGNELLELVGLSGRMLDRPCRELSHGEQRRLGIAQALLNDPSVLLLDEPSSGLDPEARVQLLQRVRELAVGKVVVLSSHTLSDIGQLADWVLLLDRGRVRVMEARDEFVTAAEGHVFEAEVGTEELAGLLERGEVRVVGRVVLAPGLFRVRLVAVDSSSGGPMLPGGNGAAVEWRGVPAGFEEAYVLRQIGDPP